MRDHAGGAAHARRGGLGGGQHVIWIAPTLDLVAVVRWVDRQHCDALLGRIANSVTTVGAKKHTIQDGGNW